jgi:diguanylate cyclase (GGDEF)-like protein/PAS domain S-box-containing protein
MYQFYPYHLVLLFSFSLVLYLTVKTGGQVQTRNAGLLLGILFLVLVWIAVQGMELAASDLRTKLFWANLHYIPIIGTPTLFLLLSLSHTGRFRLVKSRLFTGLLAAAALGLNLLVWTNDYHFLFRREVFLDTSWIIPFAGKAYGPLFWPFAIYNIFIALFGLGVLFLHLVKALQSRDTRVYAWQTLLLILCLLLPFVSTAANISGLLPVPIDLTPAVFSLSAVLLMVGIFHFNLFNVVPIAHSLILQTLRTGIIIVDTSGRIADINTLGARLLGASREALLDVPVSEAFSTQAKLRDFYFSRSSFMQELPVRRGERIEYYEVTQTPLNRTRKLQVGWLIMAYDITDRRRVEQKARHMALHDLLTGLPNRVAFMELASQELLKSRRSRLRAGIGFIDIDNFKQINDRFGHEFGDHVLVETARRLKANLRNSDIIARIGGDEFAVIIADAADPSLFAGVLDKIFEVFRFPVVSGDKQVPLEVSIGLSMYPDHGNTVQELLNRADEAMYHAKRMGKNRYVVCGDGEEQLSP